MWGYVDDSGRLRTQRCPPHFCKCNFNTTNMGCAFNIRNPDLQCAVRRMGELCGQCIPKTGLNAMTFECVDCGHLYVSVLVIAIISAAIVIAAILVIILNPRFSSHMRGILFFVQMLPYICEPKDRFRRIMLLATAWVDLGGLTNIPFDGCFMKGFNSLDIIFLGYLYPFLISIVLIVMLILHRCYLLTLRRNSPFQAFWMLVVVVYKFAVETSLLVLYCVPVRGKPKKNINVTSSLKQVIISLLWVQPLNNQCVFKPSNLSPPYLGDMVILWWGIAQNVPHNSSQLHTTCFPP